MNRVRTGFTLIEIIIASVIGAFIAVVAVGTLKAVTVGSETVEKNIKQAAEVRYAARAVACDLENLYLDRSSSNSKLVGVIEQSENDLITHLTMLTVSRTKARVGQPEGDVYEVEYYILKDDQQSCLMRRYWPNPDEESIPAGLLSVVAENIAAFNVRYFDGTEWFDQWPEEMESIPQLVEVNIIAAGDNAKDSVTESFIVNFAKATGVGSDVIEETDQDSGTGDTTTSN